MTGIGSRATAIIEALVGRTGRRRRAAATLVVLGAFVSVDATVIEPYRIEVSRHTISAGVEKPIVIAHLSDLHTHGLGRREKTVIEILERERPDVIVVTGDLVDEGDLEPARPLFEKLHAPLGVWVVRGNWENWMPPSNDRSTLASFGATLLVNEGALLRRDIWLAGLDDPMSGIPDVDQALRDAPPDATRIALFHSPAVFDRLAPRIDLAFAGHTHGGQVQLPLLGALWKPPGSGRYLAGWYSAPTDHSPHADRSGHTNHAPNLDPSARADRQAHADSVGHGERASGSIASAQLFVSRGVGTSLLPVRFLCRPELAVITLRPRP